MNTRQKFQEGDPITWLQVHNLLPIIVAVVSVVTAFSLLQNKQALDHQDLEFAKTGIASCTVRQDNSDKTVHDLELKVQDLEAKLPAVKGASTRAVPTETPEPAKK